MQHKTHRRHLALAAVLLCAAGAARPARAVVLEQKWTAGEQLPYDITLNGTATLLTDNKNLGFFAGVPIEAKVRGDASAALETLSVDEFGAGTIAPRFDRVKLIAEAYGQRVDFSLQEGKSRVLFNGQVVQSGLVPKAAAYGLRISRQGHLEGVVPLQTPAPPTDAGGMAEAPATGEAKPAMPGIDVAAAVQSMIFRALPTFWPGRDVAEGETWQSVVSLPLPPAPGETTMPQPAALGRFDFKLGPEETIAGHLARRVAVSGNLKLSEEDAARLSQAAGDKARGGQLGAASQKVVGSLWFDAAAGQVVRGELDLTSSFKVKTPQDAKKPDGELFDSSLDFAGTMQFQLRPTP